jgi:prefoldin subunit 5
MSADAVEYILDNFERAVLKALDDLGGELDQMRRRKDELEREVANLTQAVAQGDFCLHRGRLSLPVSARSAT